MTDQTKNVETLQKDVDLVAAELAEAKKLEDEALQKIQAEAATLKAEAILNEVKTAKEEANIKLKSLEGKTDAISKAEIVKLEDEIKKYEAMLITLNSTKDELITLKAGVVAPIVDENDDKNKDEEKPEEEKKNRFRRQIDGLSDKTEENHALKNAGRIAMGIGAGVLARKGIKRLFGIGKKKETTNADGTPKTTEERSFWQKPFGKFLKWTGIGTGAYYLIHGFVTGKWGLGSFFDREKAGADNHDPAKDQMQSYEEWAEKNPEGKEKYEGFGKNVDLFYEKVFENELSNGWEDEADMNTIAENVAAKEKGKDINKNLKGIVPYCIDNSFSSVNSILSEQGIEVDIFQKDFTEVKTEVLGWIKGGLAKGLLGFLSVLPSFILGGKGDTTEEKVENWMNSGKPEDRITELKFFFRQQVRVTTYLHQKKNLLMKKIAEEKFAINPAGFENVEEAMNNSEWMKREVLIDADYTSFNEGSILNAVDIMKKKKIFDSEIDEDTQEIVDEVDLQRDDILEGTCGEDILTKCETDMASDGKLDTANSTLLVGSCRKIIDDINDDIEGPMEESMWNIYEDLANSEDTQLRQLLKESPLLTMFREIKKGLEDIILKIQKGTFTKDDLTALKKIVNNYFAFKKELKIGANTFEEVKDENGNPVIRLGKFLRGCLGNMYEGLNQIFQGNYLIGTGYLLTGGLPVFTVIGGVLYLRKGKNRVKLFKGTLKVPAKLNQSILWTAKKIRGRYVGPSGSLRRTFFGEVDGPTKMLAAVKDGKISLNKANKIVAGSQSGTTNAIKQRWSTLYSQNEAILKRTLLKKAFDGSKTMTDAEWDVVVKYFDNKSFHKIAIADIDQGVKLMNLYNKKIGSLSVKQKNLFQLISDRKALSTVDMEEFIKVIDKIDVADLKDTEIETLAKTLRKDVSILSDATKVNAKIDEIKKTVTTTVDVIDNIKLKEITKNIDDQLVIMKKTLTDMGTEAKPGASFSKIRVNYYEKSIEGLENFKKQAHLMTEVDFNTIKKMTKYGFELNSIAKLRGIIEADAAGVIDNAVKQGDVRLLRDILRDNAINDVNLLKKVTKTDIDEVVGNLDVLIKKSAAVTDDVTPLLKNMDNIFRLFTKLT